MTEETSKFSRIIASSTRGLLIAAIVALIGSNIFNYYFLKEMKNSLKLQWRPELKIEHQLYRNDQCGYCFGHNLSELRQLNSLDTASTEYDGVTNIYYGLEFNLIYENVGASTLRIIRSYNGVISSKTWKEEYDSSAKLLVEDIKESGNMEKYNVDIWLPRGEVFDRSILRKIGCYIQKEEFEGSLENGELVIYPYTYIEYEDYSGNKYDVLLLEFIKKRLEVIDDFVHLSDDCVIGIERRRVDI